MLNCNYSLVPPLSPFLNCGCLEGKVISHSLHMLQTWYMTGQHKSLGNEQKVQVDFTIADASHEINKDFLIEHDRERLLYCIFAAQMLMPAK